MDNFPLLITSVSSLIKIAAAARLIYKPSGLLLQASNTEHRVVAVLELPRSSFGALPSCPGTYVDGVNLYHLQMTLAPSYREQAMLFGFNLNQRILRFVFLGPNNAVRKGEVQFIDPPIYPNLAEPIYVYTVCVGIPSPTFRHIMTYFNESPAHNKVVVTIKRSEVRFSSEIIASEIVAITCKMENGGCIIGGMEGRNGIVEIEICKFSINALLEASRLCRWVCLYKSLSNPAPDLVCCQVGLIGKMKFYYVPSFPIPVGPSYPPPNPGTERREIQHGWIGMTKSMRNPYVPNSKLDDTNS